MYSFTDEYGTTFTAKPAPNHSITVTLTDKTTLSTMMKPGFVLVVSKIIAEATRLSKDELDDFTRGVTPVGFNKHTRSGESEAPLVREKDTLGIIIRVFPERGNHVLFELEGKQHGLSVLIPPTEIKKMVHEMRSCTGYTEGIDLFYCAVDEGLVDTRESTERHEIKRDEKLRDSDPNLAKAFDYMKSKKKPATGKSFIKTAKTDPALRPISRIALIAQTLGKAAA